MREWQQFFARVPLVLAPVSSEPVYERGFDLESVERTGRLWTECCTLTAVPVIGCPGLAVPTGIVDGLPIGVQIIGPEFGDLTTIKAAELLEREGFKFVPPKGY